MLISVCLIDENSIPQIIQFIVDNQYQKRECLGIPFSEYFNWLLFRHKNYINAPVFGTTFNRFVIADGLGFAVADGFNAGG